MLHDCFIKMKKRLSIGASIGVIALSASMIGLFENSNAQVSVPGYYRKDGTYVQPHQRTRPDSNPYNNYSTPGNYNPNTGRTTPGGNNGTGLYGTLYR